MRDFYSSRKVSDTLFLVWERYCERKEKGLTLGLAVGSDRAALIDSGLGAVDDLRRYVESLTQKPVICLVSHGHPDHAGGAALFDQSYMSRLDAPELEWGLTRERRLSDLHDFSDNDPAVQAYAEEHCVDCTGFAYQDLKDGDVFDLGGVRLETLAMPGHTLGSMAFINHEEEYIFTGDAVARGLMLTGYERERVEASLQGLKRMVEIAQTMKHPTIYAAHFAEPVPLRMAIDLRDACEEILAGKTGQDERTHFKYAEMNDPDIILYKHVKNDVAVTYNAAIL